MDNLRSCYTSSKKVLLARLLTAWSTLANIQTIDVCLSRSCVATCWHSWLCVMAGFFFSSPTYTAARRVYTKIRKHFRCLLHSASLWIFEENAVNCVLYATKRQFQNKSQLGRICKLHVSRKNRGFKYFPEQLSSVSIE